MRKIKSLLFTAGIAAVLAVGVGASVATTGRDAIKASAAEGQATTKTFTKVKSLAELGKEAECILAFEGSGTVTNREIANGHSDKQFDTDPFTWTGDSIDDDLKFDHLNFKKTGDGLYSIKVSNGFVGITNKEKDIAFNQTAAHNWLVNFDTDGHASIKSSDTTTREWSWNLNESSKKGPRIANYDTTSTNFTFYPIFLYAYHAPIVEIKTVDVQWATDKGTIFNGGNINTTFTTKDLILTTKDAQGKTIGVLDQGLGYKVSVKKDNVLKFELDATNGFKEQSLAGYEIGKYDVVISIDNGLGTALTVNGPQIDVTAPLPVINIKGDENVKIGGNGKITTTIINADAATPLTYKTSRDAIITIDKNGNFNAIGTGTVEVTASIVVEGKTYTSNTLAINVNSENLISAYTANEMVFNNKAEECTIIAKIPSTFNSPYGNVDIELADGTIVKIYGSKNIENTIYKNLGKNEKYKIGDIVTFTGKPFKYTDKQSKSYAEFKDPIFNLSLTSFETLVYNVETSVVCNGDKAIVSGFRTQYNNLSDELKTIFDNYVVLNKDASGNKVYPTLIKRLVAMETYVSVKTQSNDTIAFDNYSLLSLFPQLL